MKHGGSFSFSQGNGKFFTKSALFVFFDDDDDDK